MSTWPLISAALEALERAQVGLSRRERGRLKDVPVTAMVAAVRARRDFVYGDVGEEARAVVDRVRRLGGDDWVGRYLRLVQLALVATYTERSVPLVLPPTVARMLEEELAAIVADVEPEDGWTFDLGHDGLYKRLAIGAGSMVSVGTFTVGGPMCVTQDIVDACDAAEPELAVWLRAHRRPWLDPHIHQARLDEYEREGRARAFRLMAELLEANPDYHGVLAAPWMYDPVVAEISPHLAYVREQVLEGGATLFPLGSSDAVIAHAIATSRTRRRLYEEGRYMPTAYVYLWRRHDLVAWSRRTDCPDAD